MRILLIHQYFLEENDNGGTRFNEMTKMWSEKGHEITVLAGMIHANATKKREEYRGKYFFKKNHDKVTVIRCHVSESYNINFIGRLWGYFSFVISSLIAGIFKLNSRYDIIIVTSPPLFIGISAFLLSRIKGIPYIFEVRDLWPESAIDTGVVSNKTIIKLAFGLEKFLYKKAKLINVLTPSFRRNLIDKKGVPEDKIFFLPNAADFNILEEVLPEFDPVGFRIAHGLEGSFVITYVGAHGVANHLIQIIDTAELLKDTNVLFLLIGEGMQKPMLIEESRKRKLTNIRFVDAVPKKEVFKYILSSDLGTSVLKRVDTFKTIYSNKTFDYMACSKPILLLIDGISRELVETADCGLFAEPERPKDIASKIRYYLDNPILLKQHGENGYRYAKDNFDRRIIGEKYIEKLKEAIE